MLIVNLSYLSHPNYDPAVLLNGRNPVNAHFRLYKMFKVFECVTNSNVGMFLRFVGGS